MQAGPTDCNAKKERRVVYDSPQIADNKSKASEDSSDAKLELSRKLDQTANLRIKIAEVRGCIREVKVSKNAMVQATIISFWCVIEKIEDLEVWLNFNSFPDRNRSRDAKISNEASLERPWMTLRHKSYWLHECT